jgi:hypothetical protein
MDHEWKQLILGVNFLFDLKVNEISNETYLLDSLRPFICHVYLGGQDKKKPGV